MAKLSAKDTQTILNQELQWCEDNPEGVFHEFRRGYIAGVKQAVFTLTEIIREMEHDNRNRR